MVVSDAGAIDFIQSEHKYTHSDVDTVAAAISAGCNAELPLGQHVKASDVIYRKQVHNGKTISILIHLIVTKSMKNPSEFYNGFQNLNKFDYN